MQASTAFQFRQDMTGNTMGKPVTGLLLEKDHEFMFVDAKYVIVATLMSRFLHNRAMLALFCHASLQRCLALCASSAS